MCVSSFAAERDGSIASLPSLHRSRRQPRPLIGHEHLVRLGRGRPTDSLELDEGVHLAGVGVNVRFLNINDAFLGQDGKIPFSVMPDQLHPNNAGYQLWADAMKPLLTEMMK